VAPAHHGAHILDRRIARDRFTAIQHEASAGAANAHHVLDLLFYLRRSSPQQNLNRVDVTHDAGLAARYTEDSF
jgi:hypothetical protein